MAYDTDIAALVIDNGSSTCKAGFAGTSSLFWVVTESEEGLLGDDSPRSVFQSVIGRRHGSSDVMLGEEAVSTHYTLETEEKWGTFSLNRPVKDGIISDWDDMDRIWSHAFHNELRVAPEEHPILLAEPPLNPKANREKTMEVMFETFHVPAAYLANQAVLCLYGTKQSGVVVLCGEDVTHIVPVYNGRAIEYAVTQFSIAGRELTIGLTKTLAGNGYPSPMFNTFTPDPRVVKDIKENVSYVALDWGHELHHIPPSKYALEYQLPQGRILHLGYERCSIPEPLFRPQLRRMACEGIHHAIYNAISKCDEELHRTLYSNIVLSGGSTMFPGIAERLSREITVLAPPGLAVKIVAPAERKYSVWIGGSILASLSTFQNLWISRAEYEEHGSRIVHQRCL